MDGLSFVVMYLGSFGPHVPRIIGFLSDLIDLNGMIMLHLSESALGRLTELSIIITPLQPSRCFWNVGSIDQHHYTIPVALRISMWLAIFEGHSQHLSAGDMFPMDNLWRGSTHLFVWHALGPMCLRGDCSVPTAGVVHCQHASGGGHILSIHLLCGMLWHPSGGRHVLSSHLFFGMFWHPLLVCILLMPPLLCSLSRKGGNQQQR